MLAHGSRKYFDLHRDTGSPQAQEALRRIRELYAIENTVRVRPPDERCRLRHEQALPRLADFKLWMDATVASTSIVGPGARHSVLAPSMGGTHALCQR